MELCNVDMSFPSKHGFCRDCDQTFPTLSCYSEGKVFLCPKCSKSLELGNQNSEQNSNIATYQNKQQQMKLCNIENQTDEGLPPANVDDIQEQLHSSANLTNIPSVPDDAQMATRKTDVKGDLINNVNIQLQEQKFGRETVDKPNSSTSMKDIQTQKPRSPRRVINNTETKKTLTRGKTFVPGTENHIKNGPTTNGQKQMTPRQSFQRSKTIAEGQVQNLTICGNFLSMDNVTNVTLKTRFTCKEFNGCINSMWPVSPQHSWFVIKNSIVALYSRDGILQHRIAALHQNVTDTALDSSGNMYLVCFREKLVLKVSLRSSGRISVFVHTMLFHPTEVAVSSRDEVVVSGVASTAVRYLPGKGREYGIFIYDLHGKLIRKYLQSKLEFQYPLYVSTSVFGEIAVGDYLRREVIIMSKSGEEKFVFDGASIFARPFVPQGLCFDKQGNVVVANWDGSVCLLLREKGYSPIGLQFEQHSPPLSLAVDEDNNLWVGYRQKGAVEIFHVDYDEIRSCS